MPIRPAIVLVALLAASGAAAQELVRNGDFAAGAEGWWWSENLDPAVEGGALCAEVPGGTNVPWDVMIGRSGVALADGTGYAISIAARGMPEGPMTALVQMPAEPYEAYFDARRVLNPEGVTIAETFVAPVAVEDANFVMHLGGAPDPWRVCVERVSVAAVALPPTGPDGPLVRVNQLGYLPDGPKRATLISDAPGSLDWTLRDASGAVVATGETVPRGHDPSAGLAVHVIDFGAATATGEGFVLEAGGATSHPFAIRAGLYGDLLVDALGFFYPARSGIEIEAAFAGEPYARPPGHLGRPGGEGNQGDFGVTCQSPDDAMLFYGEPYSCAYALDAVGGWYDAGDQGKYVVTAALAASQLMAAWERALHAGGDPDLLGDGALSIPEAGNGVPDILDEARWSLEFVLAMVVPDGHPYAGMAHHKLHNPRWAEGPLMPHRDTQPRELHRPSTAATLGLAAAAAQGARVLAPFDADFAETLLAAAARAWDAAVAHPDLLAGPEAGRDGGGAYDDMDVSDEFYRAAAELFVTTGEARYLAAARASPHWLGDVFFAAGHGWRDVAPFGRLTLATVPGALPAEDRAAIEGSVIAAAERLVAVQAGEPFGHPYAPPGHMYDWGSNHLVIHNAMVLAVAFDLGGEARFRAAALEAIDYVLGRNGPGLSYVTGYGTDYARNQLSLRFAAQLDPRLPHPPPGSLAGGANAWLQDPFARRTLEGCAPQFCHVDDIRSASTNEIAINWNAALAQFAAFLAAQ